MVLGKIGRTLRREGVPGLWMRLRHPKRSGGADALTPVQRQPFRLADAGDAPALAQAVADALRRILGPDALVETAGAGDATTIHLAPNLVPRAGGRAGGFGPRDVLLFADAGAAGGFLAGPGRRGLAACGAVLLADAEGLAAFRRAGLGGGRLFVLPALSDPARAGAAGNLADDLAGDLARWLIAAGALPPDRADPAWFPALRGLAPGDRLCLGLPESAGRRAGFLRQGLDEFRIFDGIRLRPGWQGAGWSHATIARAALARDAVPLLVCEDDMRPCQDFRARLAAVEAHLAGTEWDLFSGLLTDVPEDCRIYRVERRDGLDFIHLDYATGMVLNIYNRRALRRLAAWTPATGAPGSDTVDAWLSRLPGMRVVTTLPFLAGHDAAAVSTVFGFANRRYDSLIRASERRLARLAAEWLIRR